MRFTFLTPGTGHFLCGSCLRDHSLVTALIRAGHRAEVVPLYLPHVLEENDGLRVGELQMGGINMYLQQKVPLLAKLPRWLRSRLDRPSLLRWASRRGSMTAASGLGAMTVSMLRGENGRQRAEVDQLVAWLRASPRPDAVVLSNAMLIGVARRIRQELDVPVFVTLQGEQPFLDALAEPYRGQAWRELAERAGEVDLLIAVSTTYGDMMRERLGLDAARVRAAPNGIDLDGFPATPPRLVDRAPRTVGYLARMCEDKGLPALVDAFIRLRQMDRFSDVRLCVVGVVLEEDRRLLAALRQRIDKAGLQDAVAFHENVSRAHKLELLRSMHVLSVPALYGESFGLYLLEALASGVPFVQPDHGAFGEVRALTGGGELVVPDSSRSLADGIGAMLSDTDRAQSLADCGRESVFRDLSSEAMARRFLDVCQPVLQHINPAAANGSAAGPRSH